MVDKVDLFKSGGASDDKWEPLRKYREQFANFAVKVQSTDMLGALLNGSVSKAETAVQN